MKITTSDFNLYSSKVELLTKYMYAEKNGNDLGKLYCHCRRVKWEFGGTWSRPCTFSAKALGIADDSAKGHLKLLIYCIRVRAKTKYSLPAQVSSCFMFPRSLGTCSFIWLQAFFPGF